jgi:hypothetical protein
MIPLGNILARFPMTLPLKIEGTESREVGRRKRRCTWEERRIGKLQWHVAELRAYRRASARGGGDPAERRGLDLPRRGRDLPGSAKKRRWGSGQAGLWGSGQAVMSHVHEPRTGGSSAQAMAVLVAARGRRWWRRRQGLRRRLVLTHALWGGSAAAGGAGDKEIRRAKRKKQKTDEWVRPTSSLSHF